MRKTYWYPLLAFYSLVACQSPMSEQFPLGIEHVIVIGVDGMSPDGIRNAVTPVMDQLIADGAVKWNVRTVLTTSSSQNWASMIMGAGPEQHGIINNDWERDDHTLPPIVAGEEGIFPSIFSILRQQKPDAEIGAVYNWNGFGRLFEKNAVNYDKTFPSEDSTAAAFIHYIKAKKPTFGFVHFDHVDHAGHHDGHGTPPYYAAVAKADSLIGEILSGIKEAGMERSTLVIITADHGGRGKGHGGATIEEGEIAMILHGKDIKKGYVIQQQVYTYDLAATIAFAFHLTPPYAWIGRPVKAAFEGFDEPSNLWKGKESLATPVIYPRKNIEQQAGGLYMQEPATVTMSVSGENTTIHYTLDGETPTIDSPEYTGPFSIDSTTVVTAKAFDTKGNESMPARAYFRILQSDHNNGVNVSYFTGRNWKKLPSFDKLAPSKKWKSYEITTDESIVRPLLEKDNATFGLVYEGYLQIMHAGNYRFFTQSDDGSKLYINNQLVVDNDGDHGTRERSGSIALNEGMHKIKVEFFNGIGGFGLETFYKGPGIPKQLIPANRLFTNLHS